MKKHIIAVLLLFCLALSGIFAFIDEDVSPLTGYKPIYFLFGNNDDQVKVQISWKFDMFYPNKVGLYLAYTQVMFWDLYAFSAPFTEIDHNPEMFLRFESKNNFLGDLDMGICEYIQLGIFEHKSNGQLENSRGWNRAYLQAQLSYGDYVNFGLNFKNFFLMGYQENIDIHNHIGSFEGEFFLRLRDQERETDLEGIYFRFGAGGGVVGMDFVKGWQEINIKSRAILENRLRLYFQLYRGYAESLTYYDNRDLQAPDAKVAVRVGIILE